MSLTSHLFNDVAKFYKNPRLFEESPGEFDKIVKINSNYLQIL